MVVTNGLPRSGARRSVAQQSEAPHPWAGGSEILSGVDSHHPAAGPDAAGPSRVIAQVRGRVDGAWLWRPGYRRSRRRTSAVAIRERVPTASGAAYSGNRSSPAPWQSVSEKRGTQGFRFVQRKAFKRVPH